MPASRSPPRGPSVAERFGVLRKQLDEFDYPQPLHIDSLDLVERLLADHFQTTESLKNHKDIIDQLMTKCESMETSSEPYVRENARLVAACNELNRQLIHEKEQAERKVSAQAEAVQRLQGELAKLQLANSQLSSHVGELQRESQERGKRILELEKPEARLTVPSGPRKKSFTFRQPHQEMDSLLPKGSSVPPPRVGSAQPQQDVVTVLERQAETLASQLREVEQLASTKDAQCSSLAQQLVRRDEEIERLRNLLGGGMTPAAVLQNHGQNQLADLQTKVRTLEKSLQEVSAKKHEAMTNAVNVKLKYERAKKEMKDMNKLACQIEEERTSCQRELRRVEEELRLSQTRESAFREEARGLRERHADVARLTTERIELRRRLDDAHAQIKQLKNNEHELMQEIQRLTAGRPVASRVKKSSTAPAGPARRSPEEARETRPKQFADEPSSLSGLAVSGAGVSGGAALMCGVQQEQLRLIEHLKGERERLEVECRRLKEDLARFPASAPPSGQGASGQQLEEKDRELTAARHKIDELLRKIDSLKSQSAAINIDIAANQKVTMSQLEQRSEEQKANIERLERTIETLREQLRAASVTMSSAPQPSGVSAGSEGRVQQLEAERLELLRRCGEQCASVVGLEQQLRATEAELASQRTQYVQLRRLQEDAESARRQLQAELSVLRGSLAGSEARAGEAAALHTEVALLREERNKLRTAADSWGTERDGLLLQLDERSERLATLQAELRTKEARLATAESNVQELSTQLDVAKRKLRRRLELTADVVTTLTIPDPCPWCAPADLEVSLLPASQVNPPVSQTFPPGSQTKPTTSPDLASSCRDEREQRQQDARSLQQKVDRLRSELAKSSSAVESLQQELLRVRSELATALQDGQRARRDLAVKEGEAAELKDKLQEFAAEAEHLNRLLADREQDQAHLLEQYGSLTEEKSRVESVNHSLLSETSQARRSQQEAQTKLQLLLDELAHKDARVDHLEQQVVQLAQQVNGLQGELQGELEESRSKERSKEAMHHLCDQMSEDMAALREERNRIMQRNAQLEASVSQHEASLHALQQQLGAEVADRSAVEQQLARSHEETQLLGAGSEQQLQQLRQQVQALQQQCDSLSSLRTQLNQSQQQALDYKQALDELKRHTTQERYAQARAREESAPPRRYTVQTRVLASSTYEPRAASSSSAASTARSSTSGSKVHTTLVSTVTPAGTSGPTQPPPGPPDAARPASAAATFSLGHPSSVDSDASD